MDLAERKYLKAYLMNLEGDEMELERLDLLLVKRGIVASRERAKEHIKNGEILVDGDVRTKSGQKIDVNADIQFTGEKLKYVSRGGLKLEKAMNAFGLNLKNKICMDIGASTGGFTDCMLQNEAKLVYAIDVGTDQLHEKLISNGNVISMENCNIRHLSSDKIEYRIDFISIDVSFISLKKVIPLLSKFLMAGSEVCALIKPQFECERKYLNKKGVIKNLKEHKKIIDSIVKLFNNERFGNIKIDYSPIKGPNGNVEYLIYGQYEEYAQGELDINLLVDEAFGNAERKL